MTCKKCQSKFPLRIVLDGRTRNLNHRKYCLVCSPFGSHNTRRIELERNRFSHSPKRKFTCSTCLKNRYERTTGHVCASCKSTSRRKMMKERAVVEAGGKCANCGYDRCLAALDFHHKSPVEKHASMSVLWSSSWEVIHSELKKCDILCKNCHAEFHAGLAQ